MSVSANYFKIGLFVIGAFCLGTAAVVTLSVGSFLNQEDVVIVETYFDESVQGLDVGSPIKRRGVRIGKVEEIDFVNNLYPLSPEHEEFISHTRFVVVRASLDPAVFGTDPDDQRIQTVLRRMINEGLRARLTSQGLTGLVYLELDFLDPERNPSLKIGWEPENYYIPSAPSTLTQITDSLEQVFKRVEETDIEGLATEMQGFVQNLNTTLADAQVTTLTRQVSLFIDELRETNRGIQEVLEKTDVQKLVEDSSAAIDSIRTLADEAAENAPELIDNLELTAENIRSVSAEIDQMLKRDDIQRTIENIGVASEEFPELIRSMNQTLGRVENLMVGQQQQMERLVENLAVVSTNLRQITSDARKYPSHLIFGGPPPESEPMSQRR